MQRCKHSQAQGPTRLQEVRVGNYVHIAAGVGEGKPPTAVVVSLRGHCTNHKNTAELICPFAPLDIFLTTHGTVLMEVRRRPRAAPSHPPSTSPTRQAFMTQAAHISRRVCLRCLGMVEQSSAPPPLAPPPGHKSPQRVGNEGEAHCRRTQCLLYCRVEGHPPGHHGSGSRCPRVQPQRQAQVRPDPSDRGLNGLWTEPPDWSCVAAVPQALWAGTRGNVGAPQRRLHSREGTGAPAPPHPVHSHAAVGG